MPLLLALFLLLPLLAAGAGIGVGDARHLLLRTGFAPTSEQVAYFARLDRARAVDSILAPQGKLPATAPPVWTEQPMALLKAKDLSEDEKRALQQRLRNEGLALRAWWLEEMRTTPSPITERMTLFWHSHFVSSLRKVRQPLWMYRQNQLFRREALGSFRRLLHEVARDPAMLVYLDLANSRQGEPNENFAREVMELFTIGRGNYSEADVKEAARAFTGWGVGGTVFRPRRHDAESKTVLGVTGPLDGDGVLDILLDHPGTARNLSEKAWREFISDDPPPAEIERLAGILRRHNYELKPWLRAIFLSPAFWSAQNRATLVKSPVELVVGSLRQLQVTPEADLAYLGALKNMGQDLFAPPNVKGWPRNAGWITADTLMAREQYMARLLRAQEMGQAGGGMLKQLQASPDGQLTPILVAMPPVLAQGGKKESWLKQLLTDPVYQLK